MRRLKGFTLTELLVVIAIVTTLMAILLPTVGHVINEVLLLHCRDNLRSIHTVLTLYSTLSEGYYPRFHPYYGSSIFHPARQDEPYEITMSDVLLLKKLGVTADMMFCPFDPSYRSGGWMWNTWSTRQYTASLGYTVFINRQKTSASGSVVAAQLVDGRESPISDQCEEDTPLVADNLRFRSDGKAFGWHHADDEPQDGSYNASCNTLFRGGYVEFREWRYLEEQGPALIMGPTGQDAWWFWLGRMSD